MTEPEKVPWSCGLPPAKEAEMIGRASAFALGQVRLSPDAGMDVLRRMYFHEGQGDFLRHAAVHLNGALIVETHGGFGRRFVFRAASPFEQTIEDSFQLLQLCNLKDFGSAHQLVASWHESPERLFRVVNMVARSLALQAQRNIERRRRENGQ